MGQKPGTYSEPGKNWKIDVHPLVHPTKTDRLIGFEWGTDPTPCISKMVVSTPKNMSSSVGLMIPDIS